MKKEQESHPFMPHLLYSFDLILATTADTFSLCRFIYNCLLLFLSGRKEEHKSHPLIPLPFYLFDFSLQLLIYVLFACLSITTYFSHCLWNDWWENTRVTPLMYITPSFLGVHETGRTREGEKTIPERWEREWGGISRGGMKEQCTPREKRNPV